MKSLKIGFLASIAAFLALGMVAAAQLDVNPSHIDLNLYAGENITTLLNFSTDGVYAINLSYTVSGNISPVDLQVINMTPQVVDHKGSIPFTFFVGNDSVPQSFRVDLISSIELAPVEIPVITHGGGGGVGGGTITIINNQSKSQCYYSDKNGSLGNWIPCDSVPKIQGWLQNTSIPLNYTVIDSNTCTNITGACNSDSSNTEPTQNVPQGNVAKIMQILASLFVAGIVHLMATWFSRKK